MAYIIEYSPQDAKRYPKIKESKPIQIGRWLFPALLVAAVLWMRLYGVPDFLIPGEPEQTKTAAAEMVNNLQKGAALDDAVTAFCQDIINGAQE